MQVYTFLGGMAGFFRSQRNVSKSDVSCLWELLREIMVFKQIIPTTL